VVSDTAEGLRMKIAQSLNLESLITLFHPARGDISPAKIRGAARETLAFSYRMLFSAKGIMASSKILVGWTTVDSASAAKKLAAGLVAARLAACAQVDGPITSHYIWQGKQQRAKEWRVWVKFAASRAKAIEAWLKIHHPYSTPQWVTVEAVAVAKPYREWVMGNAKLTSRSK